MSVPRNALNHAPSNARSLARKYWGETWLCFGKLSLLLLLFFLLMWLLCLVVGCGGQPKLPQKESLKEDELLVSTCLCCHCYTK